MNCGRLVVVGVDRFTRELRAAPPYEGEARLLSRAGHIRACEVYLDAVAGCQEDGFICVAGE
jgi:hypothetical protein